MQIQSSLSKQHAARRPKPESHSAEKCEKAREKSKPKQAAPAPKKTAAKSTKGSGIKHYAVKPTKNSARRNKQGKTKLRSEKGQFRLRVSGSGTLRRVARILRGELTPTQALAAMFRSPKTAVAGSMPGSATLVLVHSMDCFNREAAPELWLTPDRKERQRRKNQVPAVVKDEEASEESLMGGFIIAKIA